MRRGPGLPPRHQRPRLLPRHRLPKRPPRRRLPRPSRAARRAAAPGRRAVRPAGADAGSREGAAPRPSRQPPRPEAAGRAQRRPRQPPPPRTPDGGRRRWRRRMTPAVRRLVREHEHRRRAALRQRRGWPGHARRRHGLHREGHRGTGDGQAPADPGRAATAGGARTGAPPRRAPAPAAAPAPGPRRIGSGAVGWRYRAAAVADAQGHRQEDDPGQADRPPRVHRGGGRHDERRQVAGGQQHGLQGARGRVALLRRGRSSRRSPRRSASTRPSTASSPTTRSSSSRR